MMEIWAIFLSLVANLFSSLIKFHYKTHISAKLHSQRIFTAKPISLNMEQKIPTGCWSKK